MNSFDSCEARCLRSRNVALPPLSCPARIRYCLGFAAARKARLRDQGRGKSDILRVAEAELGASKSGYGGLAALAVMAITVLSEGIGSANERVTVATRPFHSKPPSQGSMSVIAILRQLLAINLVSGHSAAEPDRPEKQATA